MTLPLPFELSSVNVFLIHLREDWLLVDCGLDTEESFQALTDALQELSIPMGAVFVKNRLRVWDVKVNRQVGDFERTGYEVLGLAFDPSGRTFDIVASIGTS